MNVAWFREGQCMDWPAPSTVFMMSSNLVVFLWHSNGLLCNIHIYQFNHLVSYQSRGGVSYMVSVCGQNVHSCQHLLAHPGVRHDASGQSLRHGATQHVRPEEHLRPGYVRPRARDTRGDVYLWWEAYLCVGSSRLVYVVCVRIQKLPRLLVASSDGCLYIYNVDPQDGGECVLVQKHRCVCIMHSCLHLNNMP